MRKLVIMAAALVAAGSSFAQCVPGEPPVDEDCAQVYNVEMKLKTTAAKNGTITFDDPCAPGATSICYRVISSKSYKGYYWNCTCGCTEFTGNTLDLFDKKTDTMVVDTGDIDWNLLVRIGKKNTEVEAYGEIAFDDNSLVYIMGFGKFDAKKGYITSISGSAQGYLASPICTGADICAPTSAPADAYDICDLTPVVAGTIGYGTFSIKYNKTASKKVAYTPDYIEGLLPASSAE